MNFGYELREFRLFDSDKMRPTLPESTEPTLRHSKYDLFVRHPCTCRAPKSNNDLNTARPDGVRFRVISVVQAVSRP